jgi:hypothetical protein
MLSTEVLGHANIVRCCLVSACTVVLVTVREFFKEWFAKCNFEFILAHVMFLWDAMEEN